MRPKRHSSIFSQRPYLHQRIDSWKLLFLALLFIFLLVGAVTWSHSAPWDGLF